MSARLITPFVSLVSFITMIGCGAVQRPAELDRVDKLLANKKRVTQLSSGGAAMVEQSREYLASANLALEDGDEDAARHWATMAQIALDTAREQSGAAVARMRIDEANQRLEDAHTTEKAADDKLARFEKRIARMQKILALQGELASEQERSKSEKAKLDSELAAAKKEREEADLAAAAAREERKQVEADRKQAAELAAKVQEQRNRMATVATKIQTAEALEAEKFDAAGLRGAKDSLAQAQRALTSNDLETAAGMITTADQAATEAVANARAAYAKQGAEYNVLAERKALLEAAGRSGGNDVRQEERGVVITLHDMFATQQSDILEDREPVLDKIGELAGSYANYPVLIEGYTDSRGADEANLELSAERAHAVRTYFVEVAKLADVRVKAAGYGESNPVADNSKAEGRAKNRRIEVVFLFR